MNGVLLQFVVTNVAGWVHRSQLQVIDCLIEENRVLREQLGTKRLRLTNDQRCRLPVVDARAGMVTRRPFRAPHHSVSEAALVGGGDVSRPGEISLAHLGVLFLDELAEFLRSALEALRQPLEDGRVCISRARASSWFPARPLAVAAVNGCPCGYQQRSHEGKGVPE